MKHLIITIDLPIDEDKIGKLTEHESQWAASEAYKAARKNLLHWTPYNKEDFSFKIEQ